MNHSNKKIWMAVIVTFLIFIFSMSLRLDLNNNYPKGVDTYDLYSLAKDIQEKGYVIWNIDFMTVLGMTSFSYPSGGIIFLVEMSSLTGLGMTEVILIWNIILIIIAALLVYLTTNEIFKNNIVALLTTLIYLNARFFIAYSTYYTSRNILHIFFLTIIFLTIKKIDFKNIFLVFFILSMSFITHRATVLVCVFIFAFIVSRMFYKHYKNNILQNSAIVLTSIMIFLISVLFFGHSNIGSEATTINIDVGIEYINDIASIISTIAMHFGILIILLPIGYFLLITKRAKSKEDLFIIISILFSAAFVVETIYFFYLFLPILALLLGYFLNYTISSKKKILQILSIYLIVAAIISPIYITVIESNSDYTIVRQPTIGLISFLDNNNIQKNIICNNHFVYCNQIDSLSKNVNALVRTSTRTLIENITIEKDAKLNMFSIRNKIDVKEKIIGTTLFSDTYTAAIINWNTPKPTMDKLIDFTNIGYILDSNNLDSIQNRPTINKKFGKTTSQIYDNGLQKVIVI